MEKPNKFLYVILSHLARVYTRLVKNHHFHNPHHIKVVSPSFVISNHTSFFDFLYVMWALKSTPVNFVVARKYFETKPLSTILKWGHTIPKSLFQADTMAMKHILEVIKKGGVVSIFPEGQISITGVTLPFAHGFGKLVKKVGVPVYAVKTTGAYLKDPPWTTIKRQGRIDSELVEALTSDEISDLTENEIEDKLYKTILTNPYIEGSEVFKGKNLAKGLDNILYLCPHCHSEGKMVSTGNEMSCQECGYHYYVGADGWLLDPTRKTNIHEVYMYQKAYEKARIINTPEFVFNIEVAVETIVDYHYIIDSRGTLKITKDTIDYISNDCYQFSIPTTVVRYVPFDAGRNFQIYHQNQLYQFIPSQPFLSTKATIIIEEMYTIKTSEMLH